MQPTGVADLDALHAEAEQHHGEHGGEREADPGREATEEPVADDPDASTPLTARGTRQELAERHQVGVALLVDQLAADDVLVAEVPEVGDRPAERGQAEPRGDAQHLQRRSARVLGRRGKRRTAPCLERSVSHGPPGSKGRNLGA